MCVKAVGRKLPTFFDVSLHECFLCLFLLFCSSTARTSSKWQLLKYLNYFFSFHCDIGSILMEYLISFTVNEKTNTNKQIGFLKSRKQNAAADGIFINLLNKNAPSHLLALWLQMLSMPPESNSLRKHQDQEYLSVHFKIYQKLLFLFLINSSVPLMLLASSAVKVIRKKKCLRIN